MPKSVKINFQSKIISINPGRKSKTVTAKKLYSLLMDEFDEPENMKYEIPIMAKSKTEFKLINGWTIDKTSRKFLEGHISQG